MAPKPDEKSGKGSGKGNGKGNGVQKPTKKKPNKKPNDGLFTNTNGDTSFGEEPKLNNPTKTPPYQQGNGPLTPPPDDHNGMMGVRVSSQGPYNYGIRMDHGWTASDGTYEPVPLDKRHKRHVPYPSFINHSWRSMSGLSGLQLAHDAPISLCAMDTVCEHVWKCLPAEVRQYLHMPPPNGPAWWSEDLGPYNDMIKKMEQPIYHVVVDEDGTTEYRFFADIKKRPWIVWPIWVEDQWGSDWLTLIWHSKPSDEAKASNVFGELVSYDIIDFRRDPTVGPDGKHHPLADRRERILERLEDLWTRAGMNFEDAVDLRTGVCPMGLNEATSGERCFAAVKNLLNQLIRWYAEGNMEYRTDTIMNQQPWVNPYQQRVEMTGINAWILMASFDFNARIAIESIQSNTTIEVASDGKKKLLYPYDLAGPYDEPPISDYDYNIPQDPDNRQYIRPPPEETHATGYLASVLGGLGL